MERPKKTCGDGIFGWPISGFTLACVIVGVIINDIVDSDGPLYILGGLGILVEVIHFRIQIWKVRRKD